MDDPLISPDDDTEIRVEPKPEEEKALLELRKRLPADIRDDDWTLLRFLQARKLDVDAAHKMFMKYHQWKVENDIDRIARGPKPHDETFKRLIAEIYYSDDRHGRPVDISRVGPIHVNPFVAAATHTVTVETHSWFMEHLIKRFRRNTKKYGKPVTTGVTIFDLSGLSFAHRKLIPLFKSTSQIDQDYYPQMLGKMYFVNSPWIFMGMWAIAKNFVDKVTRNKICILGTDLRPMVEEIGAENLPREFRGTNDRLVPPPPPPPADAQADDDEKDEPELTTQLIGRASKFEITKDVLAPNTAIRWHFQLAAKDIGFSVTWQPKSRAGDAELVVPYARHVAEKGPVQSEFIALEEGQCKLIWDNSYSMMTSKTVHYDVVMGNATDNAPEPSPSPRPGPPSS